MTCLQDRKKYLKDVQKIVWKINLPYCNKTFRLKIYVAMLLAA